MSAKKRPASASADDDDPAAKRAGLLADSQPKLRLIYFNISGKGEPLRLLMRYAGLAFEDYRFADRSEFASMKANGELSFGQVPALVVEDSCQKITLVQTAAIARYIAKIAGGACGLYPANPLKAAQVDALVDQCTDMMCSVLCAKYQDRFGFDDALGGMDGEGTKKVEHALQSSVMPRHLDFFESVLASSSTGWLADTELPTIADFVAGCQLQQLATNAMVKGSELVPKYVKIVAHTDKLLNLPAVKSYYAEKGS